MKFIHIFTFIFFSLIVLSAEERRSSFRFSYGISSPETLELYNKIFEEKFLTLAPQTNVVTNKKIKEFSKILQHYNFQFRQAVGANGFVQLGWETFNASFAQSTITMSNTNNGNSINEEIANFKRDFKRYYALLGYKKIWTKDFSTSLAFGPSMKIQTYRIQPYFEKSETLTSHTYGAYFHSELEYMLLPRLGLYSYFAFDQSLYTKNTEGTSDIYASGFNIFGNKSESDRDYSINNYSYGFGLAYYLKGSDREN